MKYALLVLSMYSFNSHASWTELKYNTSSECFNTGIKRVFVPFPGFGTLACLKDAATQLPDYEKSANLLGGHTAGLVGVGLASFLVLVAAAYLKIPAANTILGPEITHCLIKAPKSIVKNIFKNLDSNSCKKS